MIALEILDQRSMKNDITCKSLFQKNHRNIYGKIFVRYIQ